MKKYIQAAQSDDEKMIKQLLRDYILKPINETDPELYKTLRNILFDRTTKINWSNAWDCMLEYMPDLEDLVDTKYGTASNIIYVDQLPEGKKNAISNILYRDGYSLEQIDEIMNEKISDIRGISEYIDSILDH